MEDIVLYGGTERLKFDPAKHRYTRGGKKVPSVTSILGVIAKPFLMNWAVNETARFVLENWMPFTAYTPSEINRIVTDAKAARNSTSGSATEIGRQAHEWIESHIQHRINGGTYTAMLPARSTVRLAIEAFLQWERTHDIEYLYSERRCYSRDFNYSGTIDLLARIDGVLSVVDFKTSKAIYPDYYLQGAAYALALHEEGIVPDLNEAQIVIVRIPKDGGELEVGTATDIPPLIEVFKSAITLWNYTNEKGK